MYVFAVARGRYDPRIICRVSGWPRYYYLRRAALADVVCAIVGLLIAARLRFGDDVTGTYVALSLALAVLWIRALFSHTINLGLPPGYVLIAWPSATVLDLVTRFGIRKRLAPPDEAAKYADRTRRRLAVKPGLTGLWQASGKQICPGRNRPAAYQRIADGDTLVRPTSRIQHDCLPETDNCATPTDLPPSHDGAVGSRVCIDGREGTGCQSRILIAHTSRGSCAVP